VGCIPRSFWFYAAHFGEDFEDAVGFGWTVGERHVDWAKLIANKNTEVNRLNGVYRKLLQDSGVTIMESRAEVVDRTRLLWTERNHREIYPCRRR